MRVDNSPQPAPRRPFRHGRLWVAVLLLCAIALVTLMVRFGGQGQAAPVGMDGRVVTPDPDARVSAQDATLMNVASTPYQLSVPSVGLKVGVAAMSALGDTITPPGFSEAFWVRNVGVSPEHAADGTVVVAAHSVRGGGVGPGNYLIDIPASSSRVPVGAEVTLGGNRYRVTGATIHSKTSLAHESGVWASVPGRLQLITCLQRTDGRVSVDNLVITAQLEGVTAAATAGVSAHATASTAVLPTAQRHARSATDRTIARGSDSLDQSDPRYHSWNSSQYDEPTAMSGKSDQLYTMRLSTMDTRALQTTHFVYPGLRPADAIYQKAEIVNDFPYPVTVRYVGGGDEGTVAPYLFEWLSGWNDTTLQPGQSTAEFQLQMGMPWDASGAAAGTSGQFWWEWEVHRLPSPTNPANPVSPANPKKPTTPPAVSGFSVHTGGGIPTTSLPGSTVTTATQVPATTVSCLTLTTIAAARSDRQLRWNRSFS